MNRSLNDETNVAEITPQALIEAGVQYGSSVGSLSKSMSKYVYGTMKYGEKDVICIIDLDKTQEKLIESGKLLYEYGSQQLNILVVGCREPIREVVENISLETRMLLPHQNRIVGFHYLNKKFPAGFFTNSKTYSQQIYKNSKFKQFAHNPGKTNKSQKKENAMMQKRSDKYDVIFKGVNNLYSVDDIQLVIVVNPSHEHQCVKEANSKGIPILALIDTDSNCSDCTYFIPCNDNSPNSVSFILNYLKGQYTKGLSVSSANRQTHKHQESQSHKQEQ